jgi:hypothetical protein
MKSLKFKIKIVVILTILILCVGLGLKSLADEKFNSLEYFNLGNKLIEHIKGTHEFKNEEIIFTKADNNKYFIVMQGDESPSNSILQIKDKAVTWINIDRLGNSNVSEEWYQFKLPFIKNLKWIHSLRGWKQTYKVIGTNLTVKTPTGEFKNCIEISISWVAHESDFDGVQENLLFLAPHLAIIKIQKFNNGQMWHEEYLTSWEGGTQSQNTATR